MESLNSTAEDAGVAGDIFYGSYWDAEALNEFLRASSGVNFDAKFAEGSDYFVETVLMEDGDELT